MYVCVVYVWVYMLLWVYNLPFSMCVGTHICKCTYVCVCVCVDQRLALYTISCSPFNLLRQGLLMDSELSTLANLA